MRTLALSRQVPNEVIHNPDGTSTIVVVNRKGEIFHCLIDTTDYPLVKGYRWCVDKGSRTNYVRGNPLNENGSRHIKMHQLLSGRSGADHKNCNGLDNRRSNLREATRTEQARNRRKCRRKAHSQYLGVSWQSSKSPEGVGAFVASIKVNRKSVYLGRFKSEVEAAKAYNDAAKLHFGEFARLNEIPESIAA